MDATIKQETVDSLREVYESCHGAWRGCVWTTDHGATRLDLDGYDAAHLRVVADRIEAGTATDEDWDSIPQADSVEDLDLVGPDASEEEEAEAAKEHIEILVADLRSGADWLDECSSNAASSEAYGAEAMAHIEVGDLDAALTAARSACSCESKYGDDPVWGQLRAAIEEAMASEASAAAYNEQGEMRAR